MRNAIVTLLLLTISNMLYAQNHLPADETAIRDNVKQLETGNKKSGAIFARPFAEDAACEAGDRI